MSGNYWEGGTLYNEDGESVVATPADLDEMKRLGLTTEAWLEYREHKKQQLTEVEVSLIAAIAKAPSQLSSVTDMGIQPRDFWDESHRSIFAAMLSLQRDALPIEPVTISARLKRETHNGKTAFDFVGSGNLSRILESPCSTENVKSYAELLLDHGRRRRYEELGRDLQRQARSSRSLTEIDGMLQYFVLSVKKLAPQKERPKTMKELMTNHSDLRPAILEGLLREGEIMNIIAAPKMGKSWLVTCLALTVVTGKWWLQSYRTTKGKVLILDNELHEETSAHRIPKVAEAMGISPEDFQDDLLVENMRGSLKDINSLGQYLMQFSPGELKLVILDAFYRFLPPGTDENDNAAMAQIYNTLDCYAARLKCGFVLIHHATKGNQSGKGVTDVGAGAGAQSRAADTHLILRPHQDTDVVVLDAVTRSWKPVEPICLQWQFPIWTPNNSLDPVLLRPDRPRRPKEQADKDNQEKAAPWTAERFAKEFITAVPQPKLAIIDDAIKAGIADKKAEKLLSTAAAKKFAFPWVDPDDKRKSLYANVKQPLKAGPLPPETPPKEPLETPNNIYPSPPSTPQT